MYQHGSLTVTRYHANMLIIKEIGCEMHRSSLYWISKKIPNLKLFSNKRFNKSLDNQQASLPSLAGLIFSLTPFALCIVNQRSPPPAWTRSCLTEKSLSSSPQPCLFPTVWPYANYSPLPLFWPRMYYLVNEENKARKLFKSFHKPGDGWLAMVIPSF